LLLKNKKTMDKLNPNASLVREAERKTNEANKAKR
jgi:hypothetical protein